MDLEIDAGRFKAHEVVILSSEKVPLGQKCAPAVLCTVLVWHSRSNNRNHRIRYDEGATFYHAAAHHAQGSLHITVGSLVRFKIK